MALISMRQMLDHAAEFGYGVPAFNVNNLEQMRAIMEAADKTDSPVIVQASAGARKYAGAPFLRHLILAAIEEFPHIPVCMHQDHGTSPDVFAGTGRSLDDHGGVGLVSGFHDGAHLLKVVDVEGWNAIAEFGCVVQHLAHADKCHCESLSRSRVVNRASLP